MTLGGHIIIRSQIRDALSKPLHLAALPTAKQQAVNAILMHPNDEWTDQDVAVLVNAMEWLACHFPNS